MAHDPWPVVRVACTHLAGGIGGAQGVALGAACLALVEANQRKAGPRDGLAAASCSCVRLPAPPPCACSDLDALLLIEASEDANQHPYLYHLE